MFSLYSINPGLRNKNVLQFETIVTKRYEEGGKNNIT